MLNKGERINKTANAVLALSLLQVSAKRYEICSTATYLESSQIICCWEYPLDMTVQGERVVNVQPKDQLFVFAHVLHIHRLKLS
jgi:hypothetical protein